MEDKGAFRSMTIQGLLVLAVLFGASKLKWSITETQAGEYVTWGLGALAFLWTLIGRLRLGGISGLIKKPDGQ